MDPSSKKLDRAELIRLVKQIMSSSGCMMDVDAMIATFERNVPYQGAGELIFHPPSGKAMTAEEIVDLALHG
jgi:hypothetical protein